MLVIIVGVVFGFVMVEWGMGVVGVVGVLCLDYVVIVVEENHFYSEIIGNVVVLYINLFV